MGPPPWPPTLTLLLLPRLPATTPTLVAPSTLSRGTLRPPPMPMPRPMLMLTTPTPDMPATLTPTPMEDTDTPLPTPIADTGATTTGPTDTPTMVKSRA